MPVNNPPRGTLLIHRGALGDLLGVTPTVYALRDAFPDDPITLLTHPERGRVLVRGGLVDDVQDVNAAAWLPLFTGPAVPESLRAYCGRFARAIAWVHDPEHVLQRTLRIAGIAHPVVWPPFGLKGESPHAEHLAGALATFGLSAPVPAMPLPVHADDVATGANWVAAHLPHDARPILAVHPGSGSAKKNWPAAAFRDVIAHVRTEMAARILMVLGPAECEAGQHDPWSDYSDAVAAALPLPLLAGVLRHCAAWLGNDAGTTHLAALLGVPTVAVFGEAGDPAVWAPQGPAVTLVRAACGPHVTADPDAIRMVLDALRAAAADEAPRAILSEWV